MHQHHDTPTVSRRAAKVLRQDAARSRQCRSGPCEVTAGDAPCITSPPQLGQQADSFRKRRLPADIDATGRTCPCLWCAVARSVGTDYRMNSPARRLTGSHVTIARTIDTQCGHGCGLPRTPADDGPGRAPAGGRRSHLRMGCLRHRQPSRAMSAVIQSRLDAESCNPIPICWRTHLGEGLWTHTPEDQRCIRRHTAAASHQVRVLPERPNRRFTGQFSAENWPHLSIYLSSIYPLRGHDIDGIGCAPARLTRSPSTPARSAGSSHVDSHRGDRPTTFCRGQTGSPATGAVRRSLAPRSANALRSLSA